MAVKRNVIANYAGAGVAALAPMLSLPWYLQALGHQQYGLIAVIAMFQTLLGLLDAGMGQALVREFAVRFENIAGQRRSVAALLFAFERVYWGFAWCAAGALALAAGPLAGHWLRLGDMPSTVGEMAIFGAAAIFAFQFPGSVYRSLLVGAQAQVALNALIFAGTLLRHLGGVLVVVSVPHIGAYLVWHAVVALLETLARRYWAWRTLDCEGLQVRWETGELRQVWRLVAAMTGATWMGTLTIQMDRIVLSRMVSIEQFGYYTVAVTVAAGVLQLIYPLVQATLPRAIQLRHDAVALHRLGVKLFFLIGCVVVGGSVVFLVAGRWLLSVWLRDAQAAAAVYPLLAILLLGTAMNAFYNVGYVYWIVHDRSRRLLQVNALALLLSVAFIPPLVEWRGTIGAAFGWLTINLLGLVLSLEWLHRKKNESPH